MRRAQVGARVGGLLLFASWAIGCSAVPPSGEAGSTASGGSAGSSGIGGAPGGSGGDGTLGGFAAVAEAVRVDLAASDATAASVAIWHSDEIVWVGGFGTIDPTGERPPGENTLFMIGSDTKKITALSLLRRVQSGQATLDTTVAEVVPELVMPYAPDFPDASIRDLLTHQGGIVDGAEPGDTTNDAALESYALGTFAQTYYQMAPPGRIHNYSNPNFSIAGLIDQRLDGRMWADIVEQDIFAPLGMHRTVARKSEVDHDHAFGFGLTGTGDHSDAVVPLQELWESGFSRPAGLVWSTPSDQMRLAAFLVDGQADVLAPVLLEELTRSQVRTDPDFESSYGLGIYVTRGLSIGDSWYDVPVWLHGGDTLTHSSSFMILPEQRFAISILSNASAADFTHSLETATQTMVDLPDPGVPPPIPFDATALDALTGIYVDEMNIGEVIVGRVGSLLTVDAPTLAQAQVPYGQALTPISTHLWLWKIDGEEFDVTFVEGPDGEMYLRNRMFVAVRLPPS
jgi:CubicO group peptidase (beta-lactamase class C family)